MDKTKNYISDFVLCSSYQNFSEEIISIAKRSFLDVVGCIIAGVTTQASIIARNFSSNFSGPAEATVFGKNGKVGCAIAAFSNSITASDLDADDGHRGAMGHPGSAIIPSALSVCQKNNLNGKQFIEGIVVGYEVGIRMGMIVNRDHKSQFIGSGNWVSYGVAASIAKLLNMGKEKCVDALGICEAHAPNAPLGWMFSRKYSMIKESIGWGSLVGVFAAFLANEGMTGTLSLCEGYESLFSSLGKKFEIANVYFKQYSCCRYTHSAIEAILSLKNEKKIRNEDIERINIGTFDFALNLCSKCPESIQEAQYSIPFTVGAALVYGEVGPMEINENRLQDKKILALSEKVYLHYDPDIEKNFPNFTMARVEIKLLDGKILCREVFPMKGDCQRPLTRDEIEKKFRKFSSALLNRYKLEEILFLYEKLEEVENMDNFIEIINRSIIEAYKNKKKEDRLWNSIAS